MIQTQKLERILVITANRVGDTGTISFKFMRDCKYPNRNMPKAFGRLWTNRDGEHELNVFEGGEGLLIACGWSHDDDPEWSKRLFEDIPPSTILMDMETFGWWKKMCDSLGKEFEHHHFDGDLWTS